MNREGGQLPSALSHLDDILSRRGSRQLVVFLDYDGTVTPIVERPELAVLSQEMRGTLRRLAELCTVAIISGRDRSDVAQRVQLDGLFYAGSHGFDIAGPQGLKIRHEAGAESLDEIDRAEAFLREQLRNVAGALVERKKYSVAVHFRLVASELEPAVAEAVEAALQRTTGLRKRDGKKVYEVQPAIDWDKGRAVQWLLDALDMGMEQAFPLYLGDDLTDEDAFSALASSGVGIYVGRQTRPTAAQYVLADPPEVREFLEKLIVCTRSSAP